jgi:hypothetical protein
MMQSMSFDTKKREDLRKAYNKAVKYKKKKFKFDGADFVTDYAKYMLDHLDNVLKEKQA